jgi:hypothetical protein
MLKLLESRNEVRDGPAPAVQAPHQHDIDFTPSCSGNQCFAPFALRRAGANLFDLGNDSPSALGCVFAHGADLQRQCLLVMRGNASVQSDPQRVAKNLPGSRRRENLFCGHFRRVAEGGQKLMIVAGLSLFEEVPGHPRRRVVCQFAGVPLKLAKVVERIGTRKLAGVDQAHE